MTLSGVLRKTGPERKVEYACDGAVAPEEIRAQKVAPWEREPGTFRR